LEVCSGGSVSILSAALAVPARSAPTRAFELPTARNAAGDRSRGTSRVGKAVAFLQYRARQFDVRQHRTGLREVEFGFADAAKGIESTWAIR